MSWQKRKRLLPEIVQRSKNQMIKQSYLVDSIDSMISHCFNNQRLTWFTRYERQFIGINFGYMDSRFKSMNMYESLKGLQITFKCFKVWWNSITDLKYLEYCCLRWSSYENIQWSFDSQLISILCDIVNTFKVSSTFNKLKIHFRKLKIGSNKRFRMLIINEPLKSSWPTYWGCLPLI